MINLVIVEDSLEAREGFRYLLSLDPEIQVLKVYEDARKLLNDEHVLRQTDIVLIGYRTAGNQRHRSHKTPEKAISRS